MQKLPLNFNESWSLFAVQKQWVKPTPLDFNDWLKQEAEAHNLMKQTLSKVKTEDITNSVVKAKVSSRIFASNVQTKGTQRPAFTSESPPTPRCIVCKGNHRKWECRVFKEKSPTQQSKVVAEAKLRFSCLREKHTYRQCPKPRKCRKHSCNSSHNTLLHRAERIYPSESPSTNNNNNSNAGASQNKPSNVQSSNKTTNLTSVSNVKGLLPELQLTGSSGKYTTPLVLLEAACSNSWMSNSLAKRLGWHGTALKLTVNVINTEELVDTKLNELTVTPRNNQAFEPFKVSPYVKEDLNVGADAINIKALQEIYPCRAVLDPVTYCYGNIEMILEQNVYHAIRPLEYFAAEEKCSPFAVRLNIGWVLSGPLPSSSGLFSTCFKTNMEQDFELACQVKSWYDMESYATQKQVDPRSAADAHALDNFENTTVHDGKWYDVGTLWAEDNIELPNNYFSALLKLKSVGKRLTKDKLLREKY